MLFIRKIMNILFYVILAFYLFLLFNILIKLNFIIGGRIIIRSINIIPFKTISDFLFGSSSASNISIFKNIIGNIFIFIPFGIYLQILLKNKKIGKSLYIVAITSAFVEVIQFALGIGACDIDDVILNSFGGIIGIVIYKLLLFIFHDNNNVKMIISFSSCIIGFLTILYIT